MPKTEPGAVKSKILNFLLIITSLTGYLEWGGNQHTFLFQAESEILSRGLSDPASVAHPFTVLPLAGQLLLLITLFQKIPGKILTFIGLGSLGILLLFMFVIGLISLNYKILFSTVPFLIVTMLTIQNYNKRKIV